MTHYQSADQTQDHATRTGAQSPEAADSCAPSRWPPGAAARSMSGLLLLTTIGAIDGTILVLAAAGAFETTTGILTIGLTVMAGGGTWTMAHQVFGGRALVHDDRVRLGAVLVVASALHIAAAVLGAHLAGTMQLEWLPRAGGLSMLVTAAHTLGLKVIGGTGLTAGILVIGFVLEGYSQWIG